MNNKYAFRKGSIIWDCAKGKKAKVLTTPGKGELPDGLSAITGKKYDPKTFKNFVLASASKDTGSKIYHNNQHCYLLRIAHAIPYSEYLKSKN